MGLPGLYARSCVLPVYVAGQRRSSPGMKLGLLVLSSHDGTRSFYCISSIIGRSTSCSKYLMQQLDVFRPLLEQVRNILSILVSSRIVLYDVILYHSVVYPIESYHIVSYRIVSCHIVSCHITSCHMIKYHTI